MIVELVIRVITFTQSMAYSQSREQKLLDAEWNRSLATAFASVECTEFRNERQYVIQEITDQLL